MSQHYPWLTYTRSWVGTILRGLLRGKPEVPLWSLWVGFGEDVLGNAINFRLLNFLYALFPYRKLEWYLVFRTVLSLYLSGISFLVFAGRRKGRGRDLILGCMVYLFCGFSVFFAGRHAFFLEMMFRMPLLFYGIDRIFEKKFSLLFVVEVFLASCSFIYSLYVITIPAVIYALFHFLEEEGEKKRGAAGFGALVVSCSWQYLLGLMLSGFALVPALMRMAQSSRSTASHVNPLLWDPQFYLSFLRGIVDMREIGLYGFISLTSLGFFALCFLLFLREKEDRTVRIQCFLYLIVFLIPVAVLAFSGFSGTTQRWCFIFSFWEAMCVTRLLPHLMQPGEAEKKAFRFSVLVLGGYTVLYLLVCFWTGEAIRSGLLLIWLGMLLYGMLIHSGGCERRLRLSYGLLGALLLFELTLKSYELYSTAGTGYIVSFADRGITLEQGENNAYTALNLAEDDSVFRTDVIISPPVMKFNQVNYGLRNRISGLSNYYSFTGDRICSWSLGLGNSQQNIPFLIQDLNQRTALNTLAGVKYAAALENSRDRIPYGYTLKGQHDKRLSDGTVTTEYLYENDFALPLVYAYDSWIEAGEYESLPPNRKEQAMLQGIVLEQPVEYPKTGLTFDDIVLLDDSEIRKAMAEESDGSFQVLDGSVEVMGSGASMELPGPEKAVEGELYVVLRGLQFESVNYHKAMFREMIRNHSSISSLLSAFRTERQWKKSDSASIAVSCQGASDNAVVLDPSNQYYFGTRDLLLNLGAGTWKEGIRLTFSEMGRYRFDQIEVICQPMDSYKKHAASLRERGARTVQTGVNTVNAEIRSEQEAYALIAVPYSPGWSARVNGQPCKVLPANGMFMAVRIPSGDSLIELNYYPAGLTVGICLSLAAVLILIAVLVMLRKR